MLDRTGSELANDQQTPLERIEQLLVEIRPHYGDATDAELRIAAKLLLVALSQFRQYGGHNWQQLVQEYLDIATQHPEKFERILRSNRSEKLTELMSV